MWCRLLQEITSESLWWFLNCVLGKCFDNSLYEYFDVGMTWSRVQQGAVEHCTCVDGEIECQSIKHERKHAIFYCSSWPAWGINDSKGIRVWVVLPEPGCYCSSRALPKRAVSSHVWAVKLTQGITLVCPSLLNELSWILVTSLSAVLDRDSILNCSAQEYATDNRVEVLNFLTFLSSKAVTCLRDTPSSTLSLHTYNYLKLLFPLRFLPKPIPVC